MRLIATFAFGFVLFACSSSDSTAKTGDTASADSAADAVDTTTTQSALALSTTGTPTSVQNAFTPAGCVTSATAGTKTTYTFTSCSGPYGLTTVNGAIDVDLGLSKSGETAHLTSTALSVNSATLNLDLDVTSTATSVSLTSNSTATGPRGGTLTLAGTYTATFDQAAQCVSLDGSWSTKFDDLTWSTSASVGRALAAPPQRLVAIAHRAHGIAGVPELQREHVAQHGVILDNHDVERHPRILAASARKPRPATKSQQAG